MSGAGQTERSFIDFVTHRQPAMLRTAYLLTGDVHHAEDLLQTALTKTYLAWSRVDPATAEAYVRTTMTRTYISWWRRKWRGERPTEDLAAADGRGRTRTPDLAAVVTTHSVLWEAVKSLPPKQRAAVVLRFYEDLTEPQTAELLGCSVGNVKSQISRALTTLRSRMNIDDVADVFGGGERS